MVAMWCAYKHKQRSRRRPAAARGGDVNKQGGYRGMNNAPAAPAAHSAANCRPSCTQP